MGDFNSDEVQLPFNLYWQVSDEQMGEMREIPPKEELTVGCLSDEWGFIERLLTASEHSCGFTEDLRYVGKFLVAMGIRHLLALRRAASLTDEEKG